MGGTDLGVFTSTNIIPPKISRFKQDMPPSIRKSLVISFGQTYVLLFLQFIASLIIARLLTPAELGVFSIAAIFIGIGHTLRDLGVVEYIVQEKELNEARIRSASLLAFVAAWSIGLIVWLTAGKVAVFYAVPDLETLMQILAINFVLIPFGSVVMAYLRRRLEFIRIAKIQLSVAIAQSILTVVLAYLGYSYFSMAYSAVAGSLLSLLLVQWNRPKNFPILPAWGEIRHIFSFSAFSSLRTIIQDLEKGSPDLVLGRLMNMEAVGFFGRAAGLVDLFNRLVVRATSYVALPHLSARVRAGIDVTEPFLHAIKFMTGLAWPFYAFLALNADLVVPVLYGNQWHPAVPLVQMICLGEIVLAPFYLQGQLAIATGQVRWEAVRVFVFLALRLVPLFLLTPYGLEAVVAGYAASCLLLAPISLLMLKRFFNIGFRGLASSCRSSLGVLMTCLLFISAGHMLIPLTGIAPGLQLVFACMLFFGGWLVAIRIFHHPLREELSLILGKLQRYPA